MSSSDRPGIVIPPPLIYIGGLALGLRLDRAILPSPMRVPGGTLAGWLLIAAGTVVGVSGAVMFRMHRTGVLPHRPATSVVQDGPYRFTRNPMYLGMTLAYLGISLLLAKWWPLATLPLVIWAMHPLVILREERYLSARFGGEYDEYRSRVRRWI